MSRYKYQIKYQRVVCSVAVRYLCDPAQKCISNPWRCLLEGWNM